MDPTLGKILRQKVVHYADLFAGNHSESDLLIHTFNCEFIGQGFESIPDDLKHIITAHAFYFGNSSHPKWPSHYNRIVFYKHPFLTPNQEEFVHSVEIDDEDGVLIFSLEQALPGIEQNGKFYNIVVHGFAEAFLVLYPIENFDLSQDDIWDRLGTGLGITKEHVTGIIGLKEVNIYAVLAHYYIYFPNKMVDIFPELRDKLFANINIIPTARS